MEDPFLDLAEANVAALRLTPRTNHDLLEDARMAVEHDPVRAELAYQSGQEAERLMKAIRLATSIQVCEALLRGETVPYASLDPEWAARYGIRDQEAA